MLFFYIGNMAREYNLLKMQISGRFIIISLLLTCLSMHAGSMSMVRCYYGYWPINYLAAIGMTILIYHLSKRFCSNYFFAWCARVSIVILCVHIVELTFFPIDVIFNLLISVFLTWIIIQIGFLRRLFSI